MAARNNSKKTRRTSGPTGPLPDFLSSPPRIEDVTLMEEFRTSYMAYSLSVITARAIPDVRDGLKPVQRRILYGMHDLGFSPDKPYHKVSQASGQVMAHFHPHGNTAIEDALVRMGQDFSFRDTLVDGQGNFGSLDDKAAAARYIECRLTYAGQAMLTNIDEGTVDTRATYTNLGQEPLVLPAAIPNLLINGASGIAVGMATNIPTHNLGEVVAALQFLLANPKASTKDLMHFVKGPDFPTGASIVNPDDLLEIYTVGKGPIKVRARAVLETVDPKRPAIVFTELPYMVAPEAVKARINKLIGARTIEGISVRDESDRRHGMRLVVTAKPGMDLTRLLQLLYKLTPLESNFDVNAIVLVGGTKDLPGQPQQCGLVDLCRHYLEHRIQVVVRRSQFRLTKAQKREHLLNGVLSCLDDIETVIRIIRTAKPADAAKEQLMKKFKIDEAQANYVLDMQLRRLSSLEVTKVRQELKDLAQAIRAHERLIASKTAQKSQVSSELTEVSTRFTTPRRTDIVVLDERDLVDLPALPQNSDLEIDDFATRVMLGLDGNMWRDVPDSPSLVARTSVDTRMRSKLVGVTNHGRLVKSNTFLVPEAAAKSRKPGVPAQDIFALEPGESVLYVFDQADILADAINQLANPDVKLALGTKQGVVKRVASSDMLSQDDVLIITLQDNDSVVGASLCTDESELVFVSDDGQLLRFSAASVRPQGRPAGGMAGIRLTPGAQALDFAELVANSSVVLVSDTGGHKITPLHEYPAKGRATGGVRCVRLRASESGIAAARLGSSLVTVDASGKVLPVPDMAKRDATTTPGSAHGVALKF